MLSKYAHKTSHAAYFVRVFIRFKHIRDTIKECNRRRELYQTYTHAQNEPHFSVPAIRHEVVYPWEDAGYEGMIYVNDNGRDDDPVLVACWDFYEIGLWYGKYQHCYADVRADWYRQHDAWEVQGAWHEENSDIY